MKRPFVFLNFAMTADGKIATANRSLSVFSSGRDREHMMELRATADAVMCGARTADLNPVTLGPGGERYRRLRKRRGLAEYNLRVVVSGAGSISPRAKVFTRTPAPLVVLTTAEAGKQRLEKLRSLAQEVKVCGKSEIDFPKALRWLHQKHRVNRLCCEGGGELADALFRAGLVDELHLTICPKIFGGRGAPTFADGIGAATLAGATSLELKSSRRIGDEMFLVFRVRRPPKSKVQ